MTVSTNEALDATPTWHLTGYQDFNELDANLSGVRFTQGIVWNTDANEWISTWQYGLARLTPDFDFLQTTGSYDLTTFEPISAIPQELADMGLDHIGDIDYADGKLYVALDNSELDYTTGYVAVFKASDLSYTGEFYELVGAPSNPHNDVASWVAVDAEAGLGYGKEYQSGNTINVYDLSDWSFKDTITMDMNLVNIQGAKVLDGVMYMSSDNDTQSVYSLDLATGHVTELFQLPFPGTEVEGIEARRNADGNVELTVELIVEPKGDSVADDYVRVFTYTLDSTSVDVPVHHTWTVNSDGDTSNPNDLSLTLREAIAKAAAGDTITFDASLAGKAITLTGGELTLSKDVTIKGDITIDGGNNPTAIHVTAGNAILDGVTVTHADGSTGDGIVVDDGARLYHAVHGTGRNDKLTDGAGDDIVDAGNGNDEIDSSSGADHVDGGAGNDTINGGAGNSALNGGAGNDNINGGSGGEHIDGGNGNDKLTGNDGDDAISGGAGNDHLAGGLGSDTFHFAPGYGKDTVLDFQAQGIGHDVIELDHNEFADYQALMASGAIEEHGNSGVQITLSDGSTLTLDGVHKAALTADDFHFI